MGVKMGTRYVLAAAVLGLLAGCDMLGIETPARQQAAADAEGKAIGSACRQSGRALEDCFALNPKAGKAAVFAGWKDMNDYMTKNKLEIVEPQLAKLARDAKEKEAAAQRDETASGKGANGKPPLPRDKARVNEKADAESDAQALAGADGESRPKVASVAESAVTAARVRAHSP